MQSVTKVRRVAQAEMKIGDSVIMMADATSENRAMPSQLYVYVDDVDTVYKRALEAGGTSISEPTNQFYGDRNANVKDPVGNIWGIATHVEDVPPEEMQRRIKERANQLHFRSFKTRGGHLPSRQYFERQDASLPWH